MDEEAGGSSQNAGQSGDVLPIQPQLVAAVTEQVLQALSNENKRGEKRRKRQQKGSDSRDREHQVYQVQKFHGLPPHIHRFPTTVPKQYLHV